MFNSTLQNDTVYKDFPRESRWSTEVCKESTKLYKISAIGAL